MISHQLHFGALPARSHFIRRKNCSLQNLPRGLVAKRPRPATFKICSSASGSGKDGEARSPKGFGNIKKNKKKGNIKKKLKKESEENTKKESEEDTKKESDESTEKESEESTEKEIKENTKKESEESTKKESEKSMKKESEENIKEEKEENIKEEKEENTKKESEESAKKESEESTKKESEEDTKKEKEEKENIKEEKEIKEIEEQETPSLAFTIISLLAVVAAFYFIVFYLGTGAFYLLSQKLDFKRKDFVPYSERMQLEKEEYEKEEYERASTAPQQESGELKNLVGSGESGELKIEREAIKIEDIKMENAPPVLDCNVLNC